MPAAFSSAFRVWTRSMVVLMRAPEKYRYEIPEGTCPATLPGGMDTVGRRLHDAATINHPQRDSMNSPAIRHDTKAWKAQVWISFGAAAGLCATGLAYLPGGDLDRAF